MSPLNLEGLEFRELSEISDFSEKIKDFLGSLDEELETWRDFEEVNGIRRIPHRIYGYACLDKGKIVGLSYFVPIRKYSLEWFWNKITQPSALKEVRTGTVIKKTYQKRGIASHMRILRFKLMDRMNFERAWGAGDVSNIARMKALEKLYDMSNTRGLKLVSKNGKIYAYWDVKKILKEYHNTE